MTRPAPTGPPPPPTVMKVAVQYAKRGRLRFASHRVIQRVFERAVRRAALPVAHSAGFTPHPKLSYMGAAPTGAGSLAEYLTVGLTEVLNPAKVEAALAAQLPPDLPVQRVVDLEGNNLALALEASRWRLELPGVAPEQAVAAAAALMVLDEVWITRPETPGGGHRPGRGPKRGRGTGPSPAGQRREVRSALVSLGAPGVDLGGGEPTCAILEATVRHTTPAVRPNDVIAALTKASGLALEAPPCVTRLAQGRLRGNAGSLSDPLSR